MVLYRLRRALAGVSDRYPCGTLGVGPCFTAGFGELVMEDNTPSLDCVEIY